MYLVDYDLDSMSYQVIDRIDTVANGKAVCTDLLAFDGEDLLATSNCEDSSVSFYRLDGDQISFEYELQIQHEFGGFCHGVQFVPNTDLVCVAIQSGGRSLQLRSRSSGGLVAHYADTHMWPKDATFVDSTSMLALFSGSANQSYVESDASKIALFEFSADFQSQCLIKEWSISDGHFDSLVYSSGHLFLCNQGQDRVEIFRFRWATYKSRVGRRLQLPTRCGTSIRNGVCWP